MTITLILTLQLEHYVKNCTEFIDYFKNTLVHSPVFMGRQYLKDIMKREIFYIVRKIQFIFFLFIYHRINDYKMKTMVLLGLQKSAKHGDRQVLGEWNKDSPLTGTVSIAIYHFFVRCEGNRSESAIYSAWLA